MPINHALAVGFRQLYKKRVISNLLIVLWYIPWLYDLSVVQLLDISLHKRQELPGKADFHHRVLGFSLGDVFWTLWFLHLLLGSASVCALGLLAPLRLHPGAGSRGDVQPQARTHGPALTALSEHPPAGEKVHTCWHKLQHQYFKIWLPLRPYQYEVFLKC